MSLAWGEGLKRFVGYWGVTRGIFVPGKRKYPSEGHCQPSGRWPNAFTSEGTALGGAAREDRPSVPRGRQMATHHSACCVQPGRTVDEDRLDQAKKTLMDVYNYFLVHVQYMLIIMIIIINLCKIIRNNNYYS